MNEARSIGGARAELPAPTVVRDALVGPLLPGSSKLRYVFAADTGGCRLEHLRFTKAQGLHDIAEPRAPTPAELADAPLVEEPALYAGAFNSHFGHMLAEGIHRLWAAAVDPTLAGRPVVFQTRAGRTEEPMPWLAEVLEQFGITTDQLLFVNTPTRFAELHVPKQGRTLGGAMPIPDYPALFPIQPIARDPYAPANLYVSRRLHMYSGSYLGETWVEHVLAKSGFEILYPETVPLASTLRKLVSAKRIVFCEGSAIHHLELTGHVDARVFVIGRRRGTAERFGRVLEAATADWTVFEQQRGMVCLDWDKVRGTPMGSRACSFTDLPTLVEALSAFAGVPLPAPSPAVVRREESLDLLRLLLDPRAGADTSDDQLGRMLRMLRQSRNAQRLRPKQRRSRVEPFPPPADPILDA